MEDDYLIDFHMIFFLLDIASIINIIAAIINKALIRFPPILKNIPINQNNTTRPPNQRKKVTPTPPFIKNLLE